eukprot:gene9212-10186_t
MAAGRETPLEIQHRLSLLDIVYERAKGLNKKAIIHRFIFIGKFNSDHSDRSRFADHYDKFFKSYNSQTQVEAVTGLLLIYPQNFLHIVEATSSVMTNTIRDLDTKQNRGNMIIYSKISEAIVMILKLSHQLSKVPKLSLKTTLDQLHEKHRSLLIASDQINRLLTTQDLCDPGQYLQMFCTPYDVTLGRDLVWPAETKLFPL